ncbi:CoA transferase [Aeromicrobium sp. YIM 150415]|uniref:CoA transferase n=1 Tax=Aeromicrobium sp. YIM 150415 TaxID=2803912 RepID=UPI0019646301|nr:CoA transferase [Aeromicrobium sp. YIM 150415]MBM9464042.1 CoA transferase [Aeromicrobium sp. YIM 150415]
MRQRHDETDVLAGLRVLDLGHHLAGPMLGMFLADHGADVIRVMAPGHESTVSEAALDRNKRRVRLDLKSPTGLAQARDLAASADVVIENFRPGVMSRLGIDPQRALDDQPHLIWCSLPGFPRDDPRSDVPAWEGVVASAAGLYPARHGEIDGGPVFSALPMASSFAAFMAAHRVAGALLTRARGGPGEWIEVSLYEAAFQAIGSYAEVPVSRKTDNPTYAMIHRLLETAPAADGRHVYFDSPLRGLQVFLDRYLPQYRLLELDGAGAARLASDVRALIATRPAAEWERIGQEEAQGALGLCQSVQEWLADEHALASETVVTVDDPELGTTRQPGAAVRLSQSPARVRWARGARDFLIGDDISWEASGFVPRQISHDGREAPLAGVRILDCATLLAGPTTTRVLAQYGADVIKVDNAGLAAGAGDPLTDDRSAFHGYRTVSSGKRTAFLDLKSEHLGGVLADLLRSVDVVHHNFTPDAAGRLGLDPDSVRAIRPSAVCSTMSLHSHGGFRGEYRGHEPLAQMATGMGVRAGGEGSPRMLGVVVNDHAAGHLNAFGVMLSLLQRQRTGAVQDVNASLSRTATLHQLPFAIGFDGRTWEEPSGPESCGWSPVDRLYRAMDGWFYLAGPEGDAASRLARIPGIDQSIMGDDELLGARLEDFFAGWSAADAVEAAVAAGFGAHRYVPVLELLSDTSAHERGLLTIMEHPGLGKALGIGHPVFGRCTEDEEKTYLSARRPGLDTIDLIEELGHGESLAELLRSGAAALGENSLVNDSLSHGYWEGRKIEAYAEPERLAPAIRLIAGVPRAHDVE